MKRWSLLLIGLCCSVIGWSQEQDIQISKEQYLRTNHDYEIIGRIGDKILLLKIESETKKLQAYDDKMEQIWDKEIELERKSAKVIGVTSTSKDFTLIYGFKRKGRLRIMARKFNNALKLLDSTTIKIFDRRSFTPKMEFVRSENKQKIAIYNVRHDKELETTVFDVVAMKVLWDKAMKPIDFSYRMDFLELLVDNEGGVHVIMEEDNRRYKKETNRFEFLFYDASLDNVQTYTIVLKGKLWFDVRFIYDNLNKKLVAGGLYSDKHLGVTNGYFFISVNPQNATTHHLSFTPFTKAFIKSALGKKKEVKKVAMNEVSIQEIVLRRDGGILMIAERNRKYTRQMNTSTPNFYYSPRYSNRYQGNQVDYYYNNILLLSIHPTGELHWTEILHKRQYSQDDNGMYSSYFLVKSPSSLRFIYNDEIKLENAVNEYIVTGKGEPKRLSMFNTTDQKIMLALRFSEQISPNEVIIPSERRRQLKLIKLTYKK